jgi:hypothetical protein
VPVSNWVLDIEGGKYMKIAVRAALCIIGLLGLLPGTAAAQRYALSADGAEVTDQKTGLIWRRCAEGMRWDGANCTGMAATYTHEAALQQAASQASNTGIAWRLPNKNELASLADKSRPRPAIDPAFPATPADYFWSASPYVGSSASAWYVYFDDGDVNGSYRGLTCYVRLVRAGQ